jgi:hypothetical protein
MAAQPAGHETNAETETMTATQVTEIAAQSGPTPAAAVGPAGPPPLIEGESAADYDALLARIANALQPADVLEEIWIRDVVDLSWEVFRLRRLKAQLMAANAHQGMAELLKPLFANETEAREVAKKWAARDDDAMHRVARAMEKAGFTMEQVAAQTFDTNLFGLERIDRLLVSAEARRAAALQELDRHRANFALRLRGALRAIERPQLGTATVVP